MTKPLLKSYSWKVLVSLGLILLLLRFVNRQELLELIHNIRWPFLIGYLVLNFFDRLIMAYKWKILLDAKKISCSWGKLIVIYFKGTFWGNLFPTSLGGDAMRAYELAKNSRHPADVVSSIIMERFIGFLSSAIMAVMVLPLLFFYAPAFPKTLLWLLIFFLTSGVFSLLLLLRDPPPPFLTRVLSRLPFAAKLSQVSSSFLLYRNQPFALGRFFLWSFGEQIVPILTLYFLVLTLGLPVPFHYLIFIIPVTQFFARIPISLSGFGIQEGLFVTLFSFLGLSATTAFALGLSSNLGNLLIGLPGAFFYFKGSTEKSDGMKDLPPLPPQSCDSSTNPPDQLRHLYFGQREKHINKVERPGNPG